MTCIICTDISGLDDGAFKVLYEKASCQRRHRADRYRRKADILRGLTMEVLLQFVLGTGKFTEEKTPDGKPCIQERPEFHHNLSHSDCWVVHTVKKQ